MIEKAIIEFRFRDSLRTMKKATISAVLEGVDDDFYTTNISNVAKQIEKQFSIKEVEIINYKFINYPWYIGLWNQIKRSFGYENRQ